MLKFSGWIRFGRLYGPHILAYCNPFFNCWQIYNSLHGWPPALTLPPSRLPGLFAIDVQAQRHASICSKGQSLHSMSHLNNSLHSAIVNGLPQTCLNPLSCILHLKNSFIALPPCFVLAVGWPFVHLLYHKRNKSHSVVC